MIAAYVLLPLAMLPFLVLSYLLRLGVKRHVVFVWKEGNLITRWSKGVKENREMWRKYCGLGFFWAAKLAYKEAKENGEWKVRYIAYKCVYMHATIDVCKRMRRPRRTASGRCSICIYIYIYTYYKRIWGYKSTWRLVCIDAKENGEGEVRRVDTNCCVCVYVHVYVYVGVIQKRTCIHRYTQVYRHTTCMHAAKHTYMHTYLHTAIPYNDDIICTNIKTSCYTTFKKPPTTVRRYGNACMNTYIHTIPQPCQKTVSAHNDT